MTLDDAFALPLVDWFFAVKAQREALHALVKKQVKQSVWLKGLVNPLDPEPWRWQRGGFKLATVVKKKPAAGAKARKDHIECALDATGRLVIETEYRGTPRPYVQLYLWQPRRVRGVRFSTDDQYAFQPPERVVELTLDGAGHVVRRESYSNLKSWQNAPLTTAGITALKADPPCMQSPLSVDFSWKGDAFTGANDGLEYERDAQGITRIWRKNHTRKSGEETMWARGKQPGWPFVLG